MLICYLSCFTRSITNVKFNNEVSKIADFCFLGGNRKISVLTENSCVHFYDFESIFRPNSEEQDDRIFKIGPLSKGKFYFWQKKDFGYKKGYKIFSTNLEDDL